MNPALDKIKDSLNEHPPIAYSENPHGLIVNPANEQGFKVELRTGKNHYGVYCDGWHEEFGVEDWKEAVGCFMCALTQEVRLKTFARGNYRYEWILERFEDGMWVPLSMSGLILFPFWRQKKIFYLQNDFIPKPPSAGGRIMSREAADKKEGTP